MDLYWRMSLLRILPTLALKCICTEESELPAGIPCLAKEKLYDRMEIGVDALHCMNILFRLEFVTRMSSRLKRMKRVQNMRDAA